jgi:small subunit ribosomal protein S8
MYNFLFNLFIALKNGQVSKRSFILQPRKKISELFLKILWKEGFIFGYSISGKNSRIIKIFLKYKNNKSVINNIKIISFPGRRVFYSATQI